MFHSKKSPVKCFEPCGHMEEGVIKLAEVGESVSEKVTMDLSHLG